MPKVVLPVFISMLFISCASTPSVDSSFSVFKDYVFLDPLSGMAISVVSTTVGMTRLVAGGKEYVPKNDGDAFLTVVLSFTNKSDRTVDLVRWMTIADLELIAKTDDGSFSTYNLQIDPKNIHFYEFVLNGKLETNETKSFLFYFVTPKNALPCALCYRREAFAILTKGKAVRAEVEKYVNRLGQIEFLILGCQGDDVAWVDAYIKRNNLDYSVRNREGMTPFLAAAFDGNYLLGQALLKKGVDPYETMDFQGEKIAAIHLASMLGNVYFVEMLVKNGIDPQRPSSSGDTAITYAVKNNQLVVVMKLVELGYDIQSVKIQVPGGVALTPLAYAKEKNFGSLVAYLESIGCTD
jgi:hypothetical protein